MSIKERMHHRHIRVGFSGLLKGTVNKIESSFIMLADLKDKIQNTRIHTG